MRWANSSGSAAARLRRDRRRRTVEAIPTTVLSRAGAQIVGAQGVWRPPTSHHLKTKCAKLEAKLLNIRRVPSSRGWIRPPSGGGRAAAAMGTSVTMDAVGTSLRAQSIDVRSSWRTSPGIAHLMRRPTLRPALHRPDDGMRGQSASCKRVRHARAPGRRARGVRRARSAPSSEDGRAPETADQVQSLGRARRGDRSRNPPTDTPRR